MISETRASSATWGARLSFAALLLLASELVVWQRPTQYGPLDWPALGAVYVALAAITLDLVVRLRAADAPSLLLVAGVYGLVNGTLIGHVATRDLPLSLIVRPLGAQPLVFLAALGGFWLLLSGRAPRPLYLLVAAIGGLAWGVWVRWAPGASDGAIPPVSAVTALVAAALGLAACLLIAFLAPSAPVKRREGWLLSPVGWIAAGGTLLVALIWGVARGNIGGIGAGVVITLSAYMLGALIATRNLRPDRSALDALTPPRAPHVAGWFAVGALFLIAGGIGYALPGSGERSAQGDALIGLLTAFGVLWLPVISALVGMRAFVQLAREQG